MKLRKGRKSKERLQSRIDAGEWDEDKGLNKPGSRNPKKGRMESGGYSRARTKDRSRQAVRAAA